MVKSRTTKVLGPHTLTIQIIKQLIPMEQLTPAGIERAVLNMNKNKNRQRLVFQGIITAFNLFLL